MHLLLLFFCLSCGSLPEPPEGHEFYCDEDTPCREGLVCVESLEPLESWMEPYYLNTCRVPCEVNDDCLFEDTRNCYWCEEQPEFAFCAFSGCE